MLEFFRGKIRQRLRYLMIGPALDRRLSSLEARLSSSDQQIQKNLLAALRRQFRESPADYARQLNDFGFRAYSQFEEDGLLLYIFAAVGFETKRVVEMCAGDGRECMAANLIINHQFEGLLFDGDASQVEEGKRFFGAHKDTFLQPPSFQHAWITANNVNELVAAHLTGPIDLLSLDVDGMDYWIWQALDVIQPRVCVFETNCIIPPDLALTVPYSDHFDSSWNKPMPDQYFRGASLKAMTELSARKGYRLIGAHRLGFNVFFLRNDVGAGIFPEVAVETVGDNPATRKYREMWPSLQPFAWEKV